jgi:hypothetical protein
MIFARKERVGYTEWAECMNLVEFHHFNTSCKFSANCLEYLSECLEQLAESLGVLGRVPGCSAESLDGLPTRSWMMGPT